MSVGEHANCRNTGLFCLATQTYSNMTKNLLTYVLVNFVCHTIYFLISSILINKIEVCFVVFHLVYFVGYRIEYVLVFTAVNTAIGDGSLADRVTCVSGWKKKLSSNTIRQT